jgi:tRNA (guanine9-N1)-methyltransferase
MTEPTNAEKAPSENSLSKNAWKRQLKRRLWEESREERRAVKRAKLKRKKEEMRLAGLPLPKKRKSNRTQQEESEIRVVLDCSFDSLMNDKVPLILLSEKAKSARRSLVCHHSWFALIRRTEKRAGRLNYS